MHIDLNSSYFFSKREVELKWDSSTETIPHFRLFKDILVKSIERGDIAQEGVDQHHVSASGQFSAQNITQLSSKIKEMAQQVNKTIVIDLRQESHGFINGLPVTWASKHNEANKGMSTEVVQEDERDRLKNLGHKGLIDDVFIRDVSTEKDLLAKLQIEYTRLGVLDHAKPSNEVAEAFIALIKANPNAWFHIHCHGGKGRATIFMIMYDMFFNAKKLSFEEIIKRQRAIGGTNVKKFLTKSYKDPTKRQLAQERFEFLQQFYDYCNQGDPTKISWTDWLNQQKTQSFTHTS